MKIDLFDNDNPNAIGEWLRKKCFKEEYGCYSCFELTEDFKPIKDKEIKRKLAFGFMDFMPPDEDPQIFDEEIQEMVDGGFYYTNGELYVCWFWDGDGTLIFQETGGAKRGVINDDCKKDHRWNWL